MSAIKQTLITLAEVDLDQLSKKELKKHCVRCIIIAQKTVLDSQRVELSDEDELLIRTKIHTVAEGVIYPEVAVSDIIKTLRDKQPSEQVDLNELISELCYSGKLDNRTTADEAREILERHLKTKEG